MAKFGWGKENRPIGFDKWKAQLGYLFNLDFDGFSQLELDQIDRIHIRLVHHVRLNTNQQVLLNKLFKKKGGKL